MNPLQSYLEALRANAPIGVAETTHYPALQSLLDACGKDLSPEVVCVIHPKSHGAGIPDGGLFEARSRKKAAELNLEGLLNSFNPRVVIEVKPLDDSLEELIASGQVAKYLEKYRVLLATNLYQFALLELKNGTRQLVERLDLANSANEFRENQLKHTRKYAAEQSQKLMDFLKRVMLHSAPLVQPKDLAWWLASYAHDALRILSGVAERELRPIRTALEKTLGIEYQGEKAEHFFVSSIVQTLFYGLFSAWVQWHSKAKSNDAFSWKDTPELLTVPVLTSLFEKLTAQHLLNLQQGALREVLDRTQEVLNRVERNEFFARFQQEHAIIYFYEPFLEAFDPELKKELGVWYTPPEIVRYMVDRVDRVLREELGRPGGLADPEVIVLDPCCGTGSFVLEVLRRIRRTLQEQGADAMLASDLRRAATERVYGFELLTAPYVVSHMQVALLLEEMGAPLSERAGIYFTNSLTGWEPPDAQKQKVIEGLEPPMQHEHDAAEHVKRSEPILVILGNPPYDGYAGIAIGEERGLSDAYRIVNKVAKPRGQGLNELYVRFFRMAERRITARGHAGGSPQGVICYISNYSWLDGLSHTGMREHFLTHFDRIWIDCLNGDKYKTGKKTPEGLPDPSVFSTKQNREGIQVGTAITTLLRRPDHGDKLAQLRYRNWWGAQKLEMLDQASKGEAVVEWEDLKPELSLDYQLRPGSSELDYNSWPEVTELFPKSFPGVKTSRDDFLVDIDKDKLERRIRHYFDAQFTDEDIRRSYPKVMEDTSGYKSTQVRHALLKRGLRLNENNSVKGILRYLYRPFDLRWLYWEPETNLLDRKREEYLPHVAPENLWIELRQREVTSAFSRGTLARCFSDQIGNGMSLFTPMLIKSTGDHFSPNTTATLYNYALSNDVETSDFFYHAIAILHSPAYRREHNTSLCTGLPHFPVPASAKLVKESAALGRQIADLLDIEKPVPGVAGSLGKPVAGGPNPLMARVARISYGGAEESEENRRVTGWGNKVRGAVMPANGDSRPYHLKPEDEELLGQYEPLLSRFYHALHANDHLRWECVPRAVWEYTLGGYQVAKKWLSYREYKVLGRALREDEVREVQNMLRRIAALLLLGPKLNANYSAVKADAIVWPPAS